MQVKVEQLRGILLLSGLDMDQLAQLQAHAVVKQHLRGEIILHEGDCLPAQLFAVLSDRIEVKKTASTGKETILRTVHAGELVAPPGQTHLTFDFLYIVLQLKLKHYRWRFYCQQ